MSQQRKRGRGQRRVAHRSGFGRFMSRLAFVVWLLVIPALIASIVMLFAVMGEYQSVRANLEQVVNIDLPQGAQATRVYARDYNAATGKGTLLASLRVENRQEVQYPDIPPLLLACVLSTEDADFYYHKGVDIRGTARALRNIALRRGEVRGGGSTITQQLARNVFLPFIKGEKTVQRKVQEIIISGELERKFTKPELLEAYLNHIYLGAGAYGVRTAAETYFGKELNELTLAECALLAGLPQMPHGYDPFRNPEAAKSRRDDVLRLLARRLDTDYIPRLIEADENKYSNLNISPEDVDKALAAPLKVLGAHTTSMYYRAPYFCDYLLDRVLLPKYGKDSVFGEGMTVVTTIDPQIQSWAEEVARAQVDKYRKANNVSQIAIVVMEARSGDVLANVGGYGWNLPNAKGDPDQFNRAFFATRQVGSSFKPFTFATAYEQGFPPQTPVFDAPIPDLTKQVGKTYPVNSDRAYRGTMPMASALQQSRNAATVDLQYHLTGAEAVINTCRKMGIKSALQPVPSLSLGVNDIRPIEMAEAYNTFPNMGVHVEHNLIRAIYEQGGMLLESNDGPAAIQRRSNRALTESTGYTMVRNLQLAVTEGTGKRARVKDVEIAGKTGTCDDFSDAWFCGFSPELVCVVWVGNDDFRKKMHRVFGGDIPAETFGLLMGKIYSKQTKTTGEGDTKLTEVIYEPNWGKRKFEKPEAAVFPGLSGLNSGSGDTETDEAGKKEEESADNSAEKGKSPGSDGDSDFYKPWTPPPASPPKWEGTF